MNSWYSQILIFSVEPQGEKTDVSEHLTNGQKWPEHRVKQQKLLIIIITFIFTFLSSTLAGIISFRQNNMVWVLERSSKWENN